ncbi:caspase-1-like [Daphnia carinata]|uniref:caspase-1-like n=1 Tax=Daphnia carinata TaxID=120202 RepID=UPI002579F3D3|nr:caspase-1-like [Daphnia carinata]
MEGVENKNELGSNGNHDETDVKFKQPGANPDFPSFAILPVDRDSEAYNMNHAKRGKAYIFNHENFNPNLDLKTRAGTSKDRDNLYVKLRELDFDVTYFNDLTFNELNTEIVKLANEDHSDHDCVLVALMSHGDDGILYAKDQQYKPEKLWSHFTSDQCPTLAGKPKLFFIQACQGDRLDAGTTMLPRITETDSPSAVAYKIPTHADFLIAYSTVPGFYSWRNTTNGSWFVQALCYVLSERGRDDDLLSLMTTVSRIVSIGFESNTPQDSNMHQRKQIPCVTSLLTRKIYFKRKTTRRI